MSITTVVDVEGSPTRRLLRNHATSAQPPLDKQIANWSAQETWKTSFKSAPHEASLRRSVEALPMVVNTINPDGQPYYRITPPHHELPFRVSIVIILILLEGLNLNRGRAYTPALSQRSSR